MNLENNSFNPSELLGMENTQQTVNIGDLMILIPAVLLVVALVYLYYLKKKKTNIIISSGNGNKYTTKLHRLYSSIPILKKFYERTYNMVQQMYPSDAFSVMRQTVSTVTRGFLIFIVCILVIILIAGTDIMYMLTGILVAYVLMTNSIASKIQKHEKLLLTQFRDFLENLRYHYNETGKVDDAIDRCMEEISYELSLHIQKIYGVITAVDIDEASELYTQEHNDDNSHNNVNKHFLLFCSICATIMKQGDRKLADGITVFLGNIKHLQEELNIELLKIKQRESEFKAIVSISMIPVLVMKPIEIWSKGNMDNVSAYYNGAYGSVVMFLIFFIAIFASTRIDNLKNGGSEENVKLWERIAGLPGVRQYLIKKTELNFSKTMKMESDMKRAGVLLSVRGFYAKKYVFALMFAILTNVVAMVSITTERADLISDFENAFTTGYAVDEAYTQTLMDTAALMTKHHLKDRNLTYDELNENIFDAIAEEGTITKTSDIRMIAETSAQRIMNYRDTYYKWYLTLLTIAMAIFGYFVPDIILRSKKKAMEMDMEDEIVQFQSIALIMMHIKEATVENTLEWMERFARCFRTSITKCILNLDAGEQKALEALKEDEPNPQFQKIVNSLMSVDRVGMEAAFDSVEVERNFLREKRKKDNEEIIHKKARSAWMMVFLMLFAVIGLWMIGPMLLMSSGMMSQLDTMMTF